MLQIWTLQHKSGWRWNTLAMSYSDCCKQSDAETSVYCMRKRRNSCSSMRPWNPSVPAPAPNKLHPSVPKETFEGSRAKGKTTDYSVKLWHMWQRPCVKKRSVTLSQTWQLNQFVCAVPTVIWMSASMMDLFTFVRLSVATNYLCFVSTILCFYQHFFNVSINNIVVAKAASSLGGGLYM